MIEHYRYVLPCGHHRMAKTSDEDKNGNKAYKKNKEAESYRCRNCRKKFDYKIDKKTGNKIYV